MAIADEQLPLSEHASVDRNENKAIENTEHSMKTSQLCALLLAGIVVPFLTARAADLYAVNMNGSCKQLGDSDKIATVKFNNATVLAEYAASQDPAPDPRDLKLAYDPEGDRIVIVTSTGEITSDVYTFGFGTTVSDSLEANRVRHVFLFPGGQSDSVGSAVVTERITRDGEQVITKISGRGTMSFAKAATETTPAQVCTGTFTVGKKLVFRTEEPTP